MRARELLVHAHTVPHAHADHGPVRADLAAFDFRAGELAIRFIFGVLISLAAALIGLRFGPHAGGLFLAFPAILPAALTLLQRHEGRNRADASAWGSVAGAVGMVGFAIGAVVTFGRLPAAACLLIATAAWVALAAPSWLLLHRWLHGVMN
jgi:Protein of unknown function (DUF3147)